MLLQVFLTAGLMLALTASEHPDPASLHEQCTESKYSSPFQLECWNMWKLDANGDQKVTYEEFTEADFGRGDHRFFVFRDFNGDGVFDDKDELPLFKRMDLNEDGDVSVAEWIVDSELTTAQLPFLYLAEMGQEGDIDQDRYWKRDDLERLLDVLRHNDEGAVERDVFIQLFTKIFQRSLKEAYVQFASLDLNGDGVLTKDDLGQRFEDLDTNGGC